MPAELTDSKMKRRTRRKGTEDFYKFDSALAREVEDKRSRGSCAECRRLKIKCDKQIPCQSCQRRGCASLCPNGSLSTGQGTRFVLAATEHLHRKVARLTGRIRQLEDALSTTQAQFSDVPHPLLHDDFAESEGSPCADVPLDVSDMASMTEVPDMHGTLAVSDNGVSRFFGLTGGLESYFLASSCTSPESEVHSPDSRLGSLSPTSTVSPANDLTVLSQGFPFPPIRNSDDMQDVIRDHLPVWDQALMLTNVYFGQFSWIFHGVSREQVDEMLPVIYRKQSSSSSDEDYTGPHDVALLFVVLAIGSLVDGERGAEQAARFHQVSKAAICLQSVLEKPSIVTVQCLHLMSIYNAMNGGDAANGTTMETTWSLTHLAVHLAHTVNRDSERWGLSNKMIQRRRNLFVDLYVADAWQSLHTGRPPSFSMAYSDCHFPEYDSSHGSANDLQFCIFQFRFASECVSFVLSHTLTAEAPTYATILELDRKVRDYPLPESLYPQGDTPTSWQRFILDHIRESGMSDFLVVFAEANFWHAVLMYVHRSYFAQALIEKPDNPLKSNYATSVLVTMRSSATILRCVRDQFNQWNGACGRYWTMWTFAFSAAVVFGTVVTGAPRSPLAGSAMSELNRACILFSKAAVHSSYAKKALPILTKLSEKAHHALAAAQNDATPISSGDREGSLWPIKAEDSTDEDLLIFAGHTRFLSAKRKMMTRDLSASSPPSVFHYYDADRTPPFAAEYQHSNTPQSHYSYSYDRSRPSGPPSTISNPNFAFDWAQEHQHQSPHSTSSIPPRRLSRPVLTSDRPEHPREMYLMPPSSPLGNIPSTDVSLPTFAVPSEPCLQERWYSFLQNSGVMEHDTFN
ncbi:fungal-specific transcription factor domain-containing protein [Desarmillaria ectypa]|nr:fungal-specific transcription factor domain-containing protein [Desarmillaria ectypa]